MDAASVVPQSVMPAYRWYFVEKDQAGPGDVVAPVPAGRAPSGRMSSSSGSGSFVTDVMMTVDANGRR